MLYGVKGRIIAGVAGTAGVLTALSLAAQQADLVNIFPENWKKYMALIPVIALFLTVFSERLNGGASNPAVREAAAEADRRKAAKR
jgi:hypothetical protein